MFCNVMTALLTLYPLLLTQGLWAAHRAPRLPEADGPRCATVGSGLPLRLLLLGDSSVAGVGAETQDDALAGQISRRLAKGRQVSYRVIARTGATTLDALKMLEAEAPEPFDVAVIGLGVNDTKNGLTRKTWKRSYARILDRLTEDFGVRRIVASGMPPVERMPILPYPLREALGGRARLFDKMLRDLAENRANVTYMPMDFPMCTSDMAPDGFHAGPAIYDAWGAAFAHAITHGHPAPRPVPTPARPSRPGPHPDPVTLQRPGPAQ